MAKHQPAPNLVTQILESIDEGVYAVDHDWRFTYINRKGERLLERAREELIGQNLWELYPRAVGSIFDRELHRAVAERQPIAFEAPSPVRPRWLDIRAYPSAAGLTILIRDITDRKALEDEHERLLAREQAAPAAAEAERELLSAVLDQMPDAVVLFDADGRRRFYNRAYGAASVGETGQVDPVGNPMILDLRLPSGEPYPMAELPTIRAIQRGEVVQGVEFLVCQPDGRLVAFRGSAVPVRGREGERLGTVGVFQDISALKNLEREREEWISIVTHDLRQPVTIILGYAERLVHLLPPDGTPDQLPAIESVLTAARNLNRMIGDLLDVSRIDTRRLTLACERVDLPTLVRAIVERASPLTGGHPIQLAIAGEIPGIDLDASRIEQVLDNLLSNAAKYGDSGTDIRVQIERRDAEVAISIANRGSGIAPEDLPRLFSRFYRTREARTGRVAGLGLGLYIAKGLVEAHGGRIWARSTPDQTTTFHFNLPLRPRTG